jgi:hypothetical protein
MLLNSYIVPVLKLRHIILSFSQGFRIRDILVRIRILGSVPLTNGSGTRSVRPTKGSDPDPDSALFVSSLQDPTKLFFS